MFLRYIGGTPLPIPNTDATGNPDYLDIDSDNDGILDSVEGTSDMDGDSIPNFRDSDSDGDGLADTIEASANPLNPPVPSNLDTDGDGLDNTFDPTNGGTLLTAKNNDK